MPNVFMTPARREYPFDVWALNPFDWRTFVSYFLYPRSCADRPRLKRSTPSGIPASLAALRVPALGRSLQHAIGHSSPAPVAGQS
jgi:hypothetical protein